MPPKLRSKRQKRKGDKTTIAVTWKVRDWIEDKGKKGEDFDGLLRRLLWGDKKKR